MVDHPTTLLRTFSLAAAVGALLWAPTASAAPSPDASLSGSASTSGSASGSAAGPSRSSRGSGDARFRLHADTDFFGFTHVDDEGPGPDAPDVNILGFGFGRPTFGDSGLCAGGGLGGCAVNVRPIWGVGFGFIFAGGQANVGARVSFAVDGIFDDDDDDDVVNLISGQLVPYFRWIFMPGERLRPYAEARFGLGGGTMITKLRPPMTPETTLTTNIIYPTVGAGGGIHFFVIPAASIDAGVNFDFMAPHGRSFADPDPDPNDNSDEEYEPIANIFNLAVLLGFSIWIP